MKRIFTLLLVVIMVSCGSSRVVTSKEDDRKYNTETENTSQTPPQDQDEQVVTTTGNSPKVDHTPISSTDKVAVYVHQYRTIAQYEMQNSGVPASIILAQGILESGAGQGDLTQRANNHFGIKCHGWAGDKVYHDDDKKGECFRKYTHPSESFKYHSKFLTSRSRYASLFQLDKKDYKGWAKGLRKAGYATDPNYPSKLISLIERYQLNTYDSVSGTVTNQPTHDIVVYKVMQGDTLYSIAKKFNLSVDQLMDMNNLSDAALQIGQQLTVQ
jgi:flagellum-specific peptidoglycan hydrolase FlgJ